MIEKTTRSRSKPTCGRGNDDMRVEPWVVGAITLAACIAYAWVLYKIWQALKEGRL